MKKRISFFTLLLCLFTLLVCLSGTGVAVAPTQDLTVGYVVNYGTIQSSFTPGAEGYGYEYLTNLLNYMEEDYTLTFLSCDSWQDGLDKLDSGEIDLLGPTMHYPDTPYLYTENTFGQSTIMLAQLESNNNSTLDDATIGVPDYYTDYTLLTQYLEANDAHANIISIPSLNLNVTMGLDDIDYVWMSSLQTHSGLSVVTGIDHTDMYFIANPGAQDLIDQLDSALAALSEAEPFFQSQLLMKYSSYNFTDNAYISASEYALLEEKGTYTVGIRDFYSPLVRTGADGELEGVCFVLMDMLSNKANISFDYVMLGNDTPQADYDRADFLITATNSTDEMGFPYNSGTYLDLPFILLENRESSLLEDGSLQKIGVASYYRTDTFSQDGMLYGREVVKYTTVQELQDAFDHGDIDSMLLTLVALNMIRDDFKQQDFVTNNVSDTLQLSLAFSERMSPSEMTVFNKLLSTIDQTALENAALAYAVDDETDSIWRVFSENPWILANLFFILIVCCMVVGITSEYSRRRTLSKSLEFDTITGLATQHKLMQDARGILNANPDTLYSFISIDIDNFKYINEMYGYDAGTTVLQTVGQFMQAHLSTPALLAHCSGDKFLLLAPSTPSQTTLGQWESLNTALQQAIEFTLGYQCRISFSIGIYDITDPSLDLNIMIDYANIARNHGKDTVGFTCHRFSAKMAKERALSNEITTSMIPGIENEEFVLYYQPKLDLQTETMEGAEVLVRWIKDEALMPPYQFIPLFEKNGFIENLDYYVLEHTCKFLKHDPDLPRLSVNLSSASMLQRKVVENILRIVSDYDIPPSRIDLEITETAFVENSAVLTRLGELRNHGFTVSMDDFGSGISSLNRLKNMELDTLKIDREFIIDALENPRGGKILEHVVTMAKDLNLKTVAEGIETTQQRDFLQKIGCDIGQGYLYARPMPEDEFLAYCKKCKTKQP